MKKQTKKAAESAAFLYAPSMACENLEISVLKPIFGTLKLTFGEVFMQACG